MVIMEKESGQINKSQPNEKSKNEVESSSPEYPISPYISLPPQTPPPPLPPPPPPFPSYYPPQPPPPPPSIYSWELYPHIARDLLRQKESKKPTFVIIGVFLLVTFAMLFPIAGILVYYGASEGIDFGGTLTLEGEVKADDGTRLSGAIISIVGTDLSTISDAQGNYMIPNAPNGIWRIKATMTGYKEEAHKVLIQEGFSDTVDFNLEEGVGKKESNDLWFFLSLAILMTIFCPFILAGSFYSFRRKRFGVVLVGAILGIFTMSPPLVYGFVPSLFIMGVIGFILSSSAFIMIITNRKAFKEPRHPSVRAVESNK
jgi:hypothetical protein